MLLQAWKTRKTVQKLFKSSKEFEPWTKCVRHISAWNYYRLRASVLAPVLIANIKTHLTSWFNLTERRLMARNQHLCSLQWGNNEGKKNPETPMLVNHVGVVACKSFILTRSCTQHSIWSRHSSVSIICSLRRVCSRRWPADSHSSSSRTVWLRATAAHCNALSPAQKIPSV